MNNDLVTRIELQDAIERFVPCPTCKQYSHSISEGQLSEALMHFECMIAHPMRGHPMGDAFDEKTRDAAQMLMTAALSVSGDMREALEKCRDKFLHYEQLHRLKCTADGDEKADRNREMAEMCEAALSPQQKDRDGE